MKEFVIEAQSIPPRERHSFIFESFDNLAGGESLMIVNNHDPIPLLNQFHQARPGQFSFEYTEQGPSTWRLRLIKNKKEGCCGFCGG